MTLRQDLLASLDSYHHTWAITEYPTRVTSEEVDRVECFKSFVSSTQDCFLRSHQVGHITGSALVVNSNLTKVLLTHHRKLGMWLQLGGHADGHHLVHEVAMTEAMEESGLSNLSFLSYEWDLFQQNVSRPLPFDLDSHVIPANAKDGEHIHYDVRYLIVADHETAPIVSHESHDVRWFTIPEARHLTQERSMHRQFDKVEWLKSKLRI
jgi:ADP-ribose pyrophosphatase YjhB (NUDIX family)